MLMKNYEYVKNNEIYPRWFPAEGNLYGVDFEKAVRHAYVDITALIPELNGKGNADEDHYMAEWLVANRKHYGSIADKNIAQVAERISQIR